MRLRTHRGTASRIKTRPADKLIFRKGTPGAPPSLDETTRLARVSESIPNEAWALARFVYDELERHFRLYTIEDSEVVILDIPKDYQHLSTDVVIVAILGLLIEKRWSHALLKGRVQQQLVFTKLP